MPAIDRALYETVTTIEALDRWTEAARAAHVVAIDTETASLHSATVTPVGVSTAAAPRGACYIPPATGGLHMSADTYLQGLQLGKTVAIHVTAAASRHHN